VTIAFVRPKGSQLWHQVVGGIDLKIDRRLEAKTEYLDSGFAMVSSAVRSMHPSATYQESLSVPGQPGLTHKFLTADRRVIYACVTISVEGKEFITLSTALRPDPHQAIRAVACAVLGNMGALAPSDADSLLLPLQQAGEPSDLVRFEAGKALKLIQAARQRTEKLRQLLEEGDHGPGRGGRMTGGVVSRGRFIRPGQQ